MIELALATAAEAMGGRISGADPGARVTGLSIDSRSVPAGGLFFALVGDHADGHDFAAAATNGGAAAAVVSRDVDVPAIVVADPLLALGRLGRWLRDQLSATVVGVTGSVGKTTTKDYIAAVLELQGSTVAPPNSFNNEMGVPLTIAQADGGTRNLVLEMGARGIGHIKELCEIGRPGIGVVLNIGSAHLGEFGSREAIAVAKRELVECLPSEGIAVLNADDPLVAAMAAHTKARVVTYTASGAEAEVRAVNATVVDGRPRFDLEIGGVSAPVTLTALGVKQQLPNAIAAAAVGHAAGMDVEQIAAGLTAATQRSKWRMQVLERSDGVTVVNDAYNASPEAMRAAIEVLAELGAGGRRTWMVAGRMAELGEDGPQIHEEIGIALGASAVSRVLVVGESARPLYEGAVSTNHRAEGIAAIEHVPDIVAAAARLGDELRPGDVVLVKAARAEGFERLAATLLEQR